MRKKMPRVLTMIEGETIIHTREEGKKIHLKAILLKLIMEHEL